MKLHRSILFLNCQREAISLQRNDEVLKAKAFFESTFLLLRYSAIPIGTMSSIYYCSCEIEIEIQ